MSVRWSSGSKLFLEPMQVGGLCAQICTIHKTIPFRLVPRRCVHGTTSLDTSKYRARESFSSLKINVPMVPTTRCLSCSSCLTQGGGVVNIFDREAKRKQKNRAALAEDVATYDYLRDEVTTLYWCEKMII